MSFWIKGVNVTFPLDYLGRMVSVIRHNGGRTVFKKGARYQVNGEWFYVSQVLESGIVLQLVDTKCKLKDADHGS